MFANRLTQTSKSRFPNHKIAANTLKMPSHISGGICNTLNAKRKASSRLVSLAGPGPGLILDSFKYR